MRKVDLGGQKRNLGRYASKLQAAMVFARHVEASRGAGSAFGNMLIKAALPESMQGGLANTIEKVLDVRETEVDGDDEDEAFCFACARDIIHNGNEILLCDGPGCKRASMVRLPVPAAAHRPPPSLSSPSGGSRRTASFGRAPPAWVSELPHGALPCGRA